MRPPKLLPNGKIPGTEWYGLPIEGSRQKISDLKAYLEELVAVASWCKQEAAWAKSKLKKT